MPTVRELSAADARAVTDLYHDYEWWADRSVDSVRTALRETDLAVGVVVDDRLVAAARVLTDFTYYTTVYDVIVAANRRGNGIGEMLLEAVIDHPSLQDVPRLSLQCRRGLVPYYESVGFEQFVPEVDSPEAGLEELVRMIYEK